MGITAVGLFAFVALGERTPLPWIVADLLLMGLGFALFSSPNINAAMSAVRPAYYGVASAITGTMRWTGQMLSIGIALFIVSLYVGRVEITPAHHAALTSAVQVAFAVFGALCCLGVLASLRRTRPAVAPV